jgi:hypothetical protein
MDRLGGYATLGLAAMYSIAEGAGFDAASHRMPSEALFVATLRTPPSLNAICRGGSPLPSPPAPGAYAHNTDASLTRLPTIGHVGDGPSLDLS